MSISSRLAQGIVTHSADEARTVAEEFARTLKADSVLALHGNLGVGKTTFVQGLARGLGVHESVTSPTFNIFTLHRGTVFTLVHLDAYRLESGQQIEALMLDDFLTSPYCLAVEWPERIAAWLPTDAIHLDLSIVEAGIHRIQVRPSSA